MRENHAKCVKFTRQPFLFALFPKLRKKSPLYSSAGKTFAAKLEPDFKREKILRIAHRRYLRLWKRRRVTEGILWGALFEEILQRPKLMIAHFVAAIGGAFFPMNFGLTRSWRLPSDLPADFVLSSRCGGGNGFAICDDVQGGCWELGWGGW